MNIDLDLGDTRLILSKCKEKGLLRNQAAYVLATALWETASTMKPVEEAYYLEDDVPDIDAWRKANLRYYPWHGRGYAQLTWEKNYKRASTETGFDLTEDPLLAMMPDIAAQVIVVGMLEGWFTGKKLSDYITLQRSDFVNARRIVNGTDRQHEIARIARAYDRALLDIGYGVEPPEPAPEVPEIAPGTQPTDERKTHMEGLKSKFRSKGVWGGLVAALGGGGGIAPILAILFGIMGYDVSAEVAQELLQGLERAIAAGAGLFAVFGRIVAKTRLQ